ncbi:MAG: (d)CMP kinase [Armatimonadota bacterium]
MTNRQPIVAIDGPAGSGKSTVAQLVAQRAGLQFISSGALYRATALCAMRRGVTAADRARLIELAATLDVRFTTDPDGTLRIAVDGEDATESLRQPGVDQIASAIATIPELRAHIVARLRDYGREGGIVMEGRDIQTLVFPDAEIKIFLTASAEERARRRWRELAAKGESSSYGEVLADVRARDRRDEEREASPLCAASDAVRVDTDAMTADQVVECILRIIDAWRNAPQLRGGSLARAAGCGEGAE